MVGRTATDFTLPDHNREPVTLSHFRGKWVILYFYPQDDTPGCICQATDFSKLLAQFDRMHAVVLGVSPQNAERHQRFRQRFSVSIPLLSDMDFTVAKQYSAWVPLAGSEGTMGRIVRTTYIIDPDGRIVWHWPEVLPVGHADRVADRLETLQAQYKK
jgi:peroxiredoxin Q/BCP